MVRYRTPACAPADVRIRHIAAHDWGAIAALEDRAYADRALAEGRAALESRGRASPGTCFVLDADGAPGGYLLALPYPAFRCPELRGAEEARHATDNLHLHDIVVAEHLRGAGLAGRLLARLTATARARRFRRISLVAVAGTAAFWTRRGYRPHYEVAPPAGYGPWAVYMSREAGR
ncbi:GNAT family N-acetyltransferase [Streptomyces sp. WAC 06738]|uniref:GNAT family N-acetyltransferase n=1 Tax=Streptomyces sp. WAC 06738 TaxID=2203210 RepID=UPI000F71C2FB|nr:GNAT family N-acetyltransferase [Streptomyces sp. WAC 06738]AZM49974.1 GNAT family N-acetyltransferase [Streptomyces sp. WAC 06738]